MSYSSIRNWESGRAKVSEKYYAKVIRFLGADPNQPARSLQERLRSARLSQGLTQEHLALSLGLHPSTVAAWEAGRVRFGHVRVRAVLLEYLEREGHID